MPATKTKPAPKEAKSTKKTLSLSEEQTKALCEYAKKHKQDPKVLLEELIYSLLEDEEDLEPEVYKRIEKAIENRKRNGFSGLNHKEFLNWRKNLSS